MSKKKEKSGRRVTPAALLLFVVLVLFLWLAPGYLYPILASDIFSEEVQKRRESTYTGVITIWQVDTFEGGTGSRTAWLNKLMSSLESQYNGVYFVVRSMTPERAKTLLASGKDVYKRQDIYRNYPPKALNMCLNLILPGCEVM